jgi:hypothetical protein
MDADMCLTVRERKKLKNRLKESTAYVFDVALLQAQVLGTAGPVRSAQLVEISKTTHKQQLH